MTKTYRRRAWLAFAGGIALLGSLPAGLAGESATQGSILVPDATASTNQCLSDGGKDPSAQGTTGWVLPVRAGQAFKLLSLDGQLQDFDIHFFIDYPECPKRAKPTSPQHANTESDEEGVVPQGSTIGLVTLFTGTPGARFSYFESDRLVAEPDSATNHSSDNRAKPFTVVAVVDFGFNPYHFDFLGHQHPWNLDKDRANNFNPYQDPKTYIEGFPGATSIDLTIPRDPMTSTEELATLDEKSRAKFLRSERGKLNLYWFPGTKVIGAIDFAPYEPTPVIDPVPPSNTFFSTNSSHGTRSAASAAGNIHGTCQECLFVLINEGDRDGLLWAASQPWIDVITNSYGHSTTPVLRDNIDFGAPLDETRAASERGQTIVFSAGNGLLNAFDVPALTYWSSEKGPDWMITVGAAEPRNQQQYSGAGKPVDLSSIGSSYPSTGGSLVTGTGTHSGTSNAAPVVAGTFGKVLQAGRESLQDVTSGNSAGKVAEGRRFECGQADQSCFLKDAVLTRRELQDTVLKTVNPSATRLSVNTVWPSSEYNYYYQGHGVISGHSKTPEVFRAEQDSFVNRLRGISAASPRPPGEENWFIVDSKCRQRLWGAWSGGYYSGDEPQLAPNRDPIAITFNHWCSQSKEETFYGLAQYLGRNYPAPADPSSEAGQTAAPAEPSASPPSSILSADDPQRSTEVESVDPWRQEPVMKGAEPRAEVRRVVGKPEVDTQEEVKASLAVAIVAMGFAMGLAAGAGIRLKFLGLSGGSSGFKRRLPRE